TDAAGATPTPTDAAGATPTSTPIPTPVLSGNFSEGAPGSAFTFTATGLPPATNLFIRINGVLLAAQIRSDAVGDATFVLSTTEQAAVGKYTTEVGIVQTIPSTRLQQAALASARYTLAADAPVRVPAAGSPPPIIIPASIAPLDPSTLQRVYLPFVVRQM
ncbi:MAG: hypothetical protein HC911_08880, partial [Chloroflexaceae bacterium]|nr:hypothetical protein [Chloroflexaceae bacterium]